MPLLAIIIALILILLSPLLVKNKYNGGADIYFKINDANQDLYNEMEKKEIQHIANKHDFTDNLVLINSLPNNLSYRKMPWAQTFRTHIGQRKLLLNEIFFLTNYGHLSNTVVYAGAAPGIHIPFLAELFPKHKFILWDPAPYLIQATDTIELNTGYFTHDVAKKYKNVLFISDIRSGDDNQRYEEFEKEVEVNNEWQKDWINIMQVPMAMLKFRIPFTKKEYEYLDGEIYLQPWAPIHSAETRLITDGTKTKVYNLSQYENQMFYFNNIVREFQWFKHDIPTKKVPGLCHCFDCSYEIWIWKQFYGSKSIKKIIDAINKTTKITNRQPHFKRKK